jgi:hypothetical protein
MKGIKKALAFTLGAAYACSWWLGARFLPLPVIVFPALATVVLLGYCGMWLDEHWND